MYTTVPTDIVSDLVRLNPLVRADLAALRDPRSPSRFQGVYEHVHGGRYCNRTFRARVFKFFELGSGFKSAEDAARAVGAFYKHHFGANWERHFKQRRAVPYRSRRRAVGYGAEVFVRGVPTPVPAEWPTADEARAGAREHMNRLFETERSAMMVPAPGLIFWRA